MLEQYRKYGDLVFFNFYYNLINTRSAKKFQWAVGFFSGMSVNTEPVIFGVCIFLNETVDSYEKIFYSFMELTGNYNCTFMTDDQKQIIEAFKKMKQSPNGRFQGAHVVNAATVLKSVQRDTTPTNFDRYRRLLKAKSPDKFNLILDQLLIEESNQQNLTKFKDLSCLTCYSQIPAHFVGFTCSSLVPQALQTALLRLIPEPTNTNNLIQALETMEL